LPVAELLGYDLAVRTGYGLVLTACVPGTSAIPPEPDPVRLRALGAVAARISSVKLTPAPALPLRSRPIEADDFAGMRRDARGGQRGDRQLPPPAADDPGVRHRHPVLV
jgi:hypothetical protein